MVRDFLVDILVLRDVNSIIELLYNSVSFKKEFFDIWLEIGEDP